MCPKRDILSQFENESKRRKNARDRLCKCVRFITNHSINSFAKKKAEIFKRWLAKVGYERLEERADPSKAVDRARETWKSQGYNDKRGSIKE